MEGECTALTVMSSLLFVVAVCSLCLYLRMSDQLKRKDAALDDWARRWAEPASREDHGSCSSPQPGQPPLPLVADCDAPLLPAPLRLGSTPLPRSPAERGVTRRAVKLAVARLLRLERCGLCSPHRDAYRRWLLFILARRRIGYSAAETLPVEVYLDRDGTASRADGQQWLAARSQPASSVRTPPTQRQHPRPLTFSDVVSRRRLDDGGLSTARAGFPAAPPGGPPNGAAPPLSIGRGDPSLRGPARGLSWAGNGY
eukprot:TRINITY_DN59997_c0_g1_i1.p1 TRINITY_DN59997_c0_g1~~TRINITY_DN59997_c0_g1_i1.p1  ORF type:complete len:278 (+),score=48.14 TRINITY_DN59997_c0_g1_i1:69-836(+)